MTEPIWTDRQLPEALFEYVSQNISAESAKPQRWARVMAPGSVCHKIVNPQSTCKQEKRVSRRHFSSDTTRSVPGLKGRVLVK